jgi:hypothetical protein
MDLHKRTLTLFSKLSLGAFLGVLVFRGDACICGGAHPPPPPPNNTATPPASAAPHPPPPG